MKKLLIILWICICAYSQAQTITITKETFDELMGSKRELEEKKVALSRSELLNKKPFEYRSSLAGQLTKYIDSLSALKSTMETFDLMGEQLLGLESQKRKLTKRLVEVTNDRDRLEKKQSKKSIGQEYLKLEQSYDSLTLLLSNTLDQLANSSEQIDRRNNQVQYLEDQLRAFSRKSLQSALKLEQLKSNIDSLKTITANYGSSEVLVVEEFSQSVNGLVNSSNLNPDNSQIDKLTRQYNRLYQLYNDESALSVARDQLYNFQTVCLTVSEARNYLMNKLEPSSNGKMIDRLSSLSTSNRLALQRVQNYKSLIQGYCSIYKKTRTAVKSIMALRSPVVRKEELTKLEDGLGNYPYLLNKISTQKAQISDKEILLEEIPGCQ